MDGFYGYDCSINPTVLNGSGSVESFLEFKKPLYYRIPYRDLNQTYELVVTIMSTRMQIQAYMSE